MDSKYLYHGSPIKCNSLIPNQACDSLYSEGCQNGVYATTSIKMAICFALGCIVENESKDFQRIMLPKYGEKMIFKNCHPNYGAKGYVYILDNKNFHHCINSQWISYQEVTPLSVIEINVNDYLDYCVVTE